MKNKILLFAACLIGINTQAQYFERWYNNMPAGPGLRNETFFDGLRSRVNYSASDPTKYFLVGCGSSFTPPGMAGPDQFRFMRMNKTGTTVPVNNAHTFFDSLTIYNSYAKTLCEITNGHGTGGYVVEGRISCYTGVSQLCGDGDALFTNVKNNGSVPVKYHFDFKCGNDLFTSVIESDLVSNRYYTCGYSTHATYTDIVVMSHKKNGTVNWVREVQLDPTMLSPTTPSAHCRAYGIAEDAASGNIYIVGSVEDLSVIPATTGAFVLCMSSAGTVLWANLMIAPGSTDNQYHAIKPTADGNFIITGFSDGPTLTLAPMYDMVLTKMSPIGATLWSFKYRILDPIYTQAEVASKGYDVMERIDATGLANYYVIGPAYTAAGPANCLLRTVNGLGGVNAIYHLLGYDFAFGIDWSDTAATKPGIDVFSNTVMPTPTIGFTDSYFLKTYYNLSSCSNPCTLAPAPQFQLPLPFPLPHFVDSVYQRWSLLENHTPYATGIICSVASTACGSNVPRLGQNHNQNAFELNIFPNPVQDVLQIEMSIEQEGDYTLSVMDVTGQVIEMNSVSLVAGEQTIAINCTTLTPGVYMLIVENGTTKTQKSFIKN